MCVDCLAFKLRLNTIIKDPTARGVELNLVPIKPQRELGGGGGRGGTSRLGAIRIFDSHGPAFSISLSHTRAHTHTHTHTHTHITLSFNSFSYYCLFQSHSFAFCYCNLVLLTVIDGYPYKCHSITSHVSYISKSLLRLMNHSWFDQTWYLNILNKEEASYQFFRAC